MPYANKDDQRAAGKAHYQKYKEMYKQKTKVRDAAQRILVRDHIIKSKMVPCMDCHNNYPHYVMDFDHRGDKRFNISDAPGRKISLAAVIKEIAKCDVVCANCHRIRTFNR